MWTHRTGQTLLGMAIMIPLLIGGCGRKGPLYLPEPESPAEEQTEPGPTTEEQTEPGPTTEEQTEPKQNQVK